jgi:hypothetical protein
MAGLYFMAMVFGFPLTIFVLSVLDWKPTRSPEREADLAVNDIDQMRASLNDLRHRRAASERSLEQVTGYPRDTA